MIRQRVCFTVIAAAMGRVHTQKDQPMLLLTLEDETGLLECTVFPKVFAHNACVCRESWALRALNRVEDKLIYWSANSSGALRRICRSPSRAYSSIFRQP